MRARHMTSHQGFSLIELAIVLVIVTILIGGLAVPLSAQIEARRIGETRKTMEEAREAIVGYAMSHTVASSCSCVYKADTTLNIPDVPLDASDDPDSSCPASLCPTTGGATLTLPITRHYLPCPDLNGADPEPNLDNDGVDGLRDINNGAEDRRPGNNSSPYVAGSSCASISGNLPWVTLATAAQDAWGNRLHYSLTDDPSYPINPLYTDGRYGNSEIGFFNASTGNREVCNTSTGGCPSGTIASNVPVVIVSYGPNGWGALTINDTTLAAPTSADELENTDADISYVSRFPSKADAAAGEFDDLVVWISKDLLISRVCQGGCP